MASPPFSIAETLPGNTDAVLPFPALERLFREVVRDWLLWEHHNTGRHAFVFNTTAVRDSITDWQTGSLMYNSNHAALQLRNAGVWQHNAFAAGTVALFRSSVAPLAWTLQSDSFLELAVAKTITTGAAVGSGGAVTFTDVFGTARPITGTVGATALTTNQIPAHTHDIFIGSFLRDGGVTVVVRTPGLATGGSGAGQTDLQGGGAAHTHGWTGTMNMDVKWVDFFFASRNAA